MGLVQTLDPSDTLLVESDTNNKSKALTDSFSTWYVYSHFSADPDLLSIAPHTLAFSERAYSEDTTMYRQEMNSPYRKQFLASMKN